MALEVRRKYPIPRPRSAPHKLPQRTLKREQRRKSARRTLNTFLVLLVLAVSAGIGYTWYMGKQKPAAAAELPIATKNRPAIIKPHKVASDAKVGVAIQMLTGEVKVGENASMTVRTNPEAQCAITVKYNNVLAKDSGLVPKVADEFGVASWAWTVAQGTPPGKWPVEVTCKNKKHSAVVIGDLLVKP